MKSLVAIYDFSLFPYAFGDVLTWNVRTAMAAHEAGAKSCRIVVLTDAMHPHCVFQTAPDEDQYEVFLSELQPAFYAHPCASSFHFFHDRNEFNAYLDYLKQQGELSQKEWQEHQQVYEFVQSYQQDGFATVSKFFADRVMNQAPINAFFKKYGFVPQLREVLGCHYDVDALIAAQGKDSVIISTQFRMRNLDQAIVDGETFRNANHTAWEDFFVQVAEKHPEVKFVLLGRIQEKPLRILALPNIIAPRALGLNLGHEISLLLRSDYFLGSSSGFAQLANFSDVPYSIIKMNQRACDAYGIVYGADHLPFAKENQKLLYGDETPALLMQALEEGLRVRTPRGNNAQAQILSQTKCTTHRFFLNDSQLKQENARLLLPAVKHAIEKILCSQPEAALQSLVDISRSLWLDVHQLQSLVDVSKRRATLGMLMPNYNHAKHLKKAFHEIRLQTPPLDQVVVVDDGSTDNSRQLIKEWAGESPQNQAVYLSRNVGVNTAVSEAFQLIQTDYFCGRSVDDMVFLEYTDKISAVLAAHPETGLVCFQELKCDVAHAQQFFGMQIANVVTSFTPEEAEAALRRNYIWDPCAAMKTEEFRKVQHSDWRMRWIQALHIADVIALRRGFCYIPEPLVVYNMREGSFSDGGSDRFRHGEAFIASARDLASDDKADIFARCVRSGFLGLRKDAYIPIYAILNAAWEDGTKPLLLILHGILDFFDKECSKKGLSADDGIRMEIQRWVRWTDEFSDDVDLGGVLASLRNSLIKLSRNSIYHADLTGFFAQQFAHKKNPKEAFSLLRKELGDASTTKACIRTFLLVSGLTETRKIRDDKWRRALDMYVKDVWFGMEYVQLLVSEGRIEDAKKIAELLVIRDGGKDVYRELAEYIPGYENPYATNSPVFHLDPNSIAGEGGEIAQTGNQDVLAAPLLETPSRPTSLKAIENPSYRVLFMTEGWADHPGGSPTNSLHNLLGSFDSTGFGTRENFFIEDVEDVNQELIDRCFAYRPDLVVISVPTYHPQTPKLETYQKLHEAGFALAFIWWDAVNSFIMALADEVAPYARLNIILDFNTFQKDSKYLALWTPQDPLIYRDPKLGRSIDVCFAGSIDGYADRQRFLLKLKDAGLPITQVGGQREQNLSVEDYAWHFQKAKISINFPMNRLGLFQTKGRLWESAACGAVMFEQDNPETRKWWTPWVDYVPFTTEEDLVTRVRDYLEHPEKLEEIAKNAKLKFETLYHAKAWWSEVFSACQLGQKQEIEALTEPNSGDFFSVAEVENFELLVQGYRNDPANPEFSGQLLELRQGLAAFILETDLSELTRLFSRDFGKVYRLLLNSSLQNELLTAEEREVFEAFSATVQSNPQGECNFRELLVYMLYSLGHRRHIPTSIEYIPAWFQEDYMGYVLYAPQGMLEIGEADRYFEHLLRWVREMDLRIQKSPSADLTIKWATAFANRLNLIPVYFTTADVRELMTLRAKILAFVLGRNGVVFDTTFPPRKIGLKKIKVGFLNAHFGSQTETYTTLPSIYLDRDKFEIHLFALYGGEGALIEHCVKNSDSMVMLPGNLLEQVATIRNAELDILLIGTNVTAVTNQVAMLSLFRLAPIQLTTNSSPMTTGMPFTDGYLSGKIKKFDGYTDQFTERVLLFDAPINCLEFTIDSQPAKTNFTRQDLGIPQEVVVFVSGSNFFKILPELQETWAKILKRVEGSCLLLHPFNPNWTNAYPIKQFERSMRELFRRHEIDDNRLIISTNLLPTRMDVQNLLSIGDVYLDSYPLSGSVSLVDPLEVSVPTVIWHGDTFRSLLAASMLSDLGVSELITSDEEGYIALAVRLASDVTYRKAMQDCIRNSMANQPCIFDCAAYGRQVGAVLEKLFFAERKIEEIPKISEILRRAEVALLESNFGAVEDLCRYILEQAPETAGAWALLSELVGRSGDLEYAEELIRQAQELEPKNAQYCCSFGEICSQKKDFPTALSAFQRAIELRSDFADAWLGQAVIYDESKEVSQAEKAYSQALRYSKKSVETAQIRVNFAGFLRDQKRIKEGIKQLRKAVSDVPDSADVLLLLGSFLQESGDLLTAMSTFTRASQKFPKNGKAWLEWGKCLLLLEKFDEAIVKMRKAVACQPEDPVVLFNLGYALQRNMQRTEALQVYLEAERAGCDTPDLHINMGVIYKDQEEFMKAVTRFRMGLERNPASNAAMNNLGAVYIHLGFTSEAIEAFQEALVLCPTMIAPYNNLGHMLKISGKAEEGISYYRKGLALAPDNKEMIHNYLLSTLYQTNLTPEAIFEEHRVWGGRIAAGVKRFPRRQIREGHPNQPIRIGYISPDFCLHPVSFFVEALLQGHTRERFSVYVYSDVHKEDVVTKRFRSMVNVWHDISEMQDKEVGELIQKDQIDILVELCGHTAHTRLELLAAKPAPITVSYLGYPASTGVPGVDYRITDPVVDPPGATDALHTEKLIRLERCAWHYTPPTVSPEVAPLPATKNEFITFGCFNNLAKLNAPLYDTWVKILNQVPQSHLFLKAKTFVDPGVCKGVLDYFISQGIAEGRVRVLGFENTTKGHLDRYHEVDIALDSYPYHGTTTTCEALWMGVPVVTRAGEAHLSRVGLSLLQAVGHPELIATSEAEYIELAVALAKNLEQLTVLRMKLRADMQASPILNQADFIHALESAYEKLLPY